MAARVHAHRWVGEQELLSGSHRIARAHLAQALRLDPRQPMTIALILLTFLPHRSLLGVVGWRRRAAVDCSVAAFEAVRRPLRRRMATGRESVRDDRGRRRHGQSIDRGVVWIVNQYAGRPATAWNTGTELGRELHRLGMTVVIISGSYSHLFSEAADDEGTLYVERIDGLSYCWVGSRRTVER